MRLFVGGLAWSTTEAKLTEVFTPFGIVVDVRIITDKETGRSRGFGFVTFKTLEEGTHALEEMGGQEVDGRRLTVSVAADKQARGEEVRRAAGLSADRPRAEARRPMKLVSEPEVTRRPSTARRMDPEERGSGMSPKGPPPSTKNRKSNVLPPERMFIEAPNRNDE